MSLIKTFTATADNTSFSVRIEKAVQHLDIQRISDTPVCYFGLVPGLPEVISAEITHPVRSRVRMSNDTPLSHIALWAQHGRGPIVEFWRYKEAASGMRCDTRLKYYLNDLGPVEIMADDHFVVKFENCIPGAIYNVFAPEMQVVVEEANKLFNYETAVILASDRQRTLSSVGKQGIILPNLPDVIERVVLRGEGQKEQELDLFEIQAVQADVNPFTVVLDKFANGHDDRQTVFATSQNADLVLLMFNGISSIQIDTPLGRELSYTLISVMDRF